MKSMDATMRRRLGFDPRQSAGVFFGVRTFEDSTFTEVAYAVDDAVDLAHCFAFDLGLIPPRHVALALAGEPQKSTTRKRLAELEEADAHVIREVRYTDYFRLADRQAKKSGTKGLFVATIASHGFMGDDLDALVAEDSVHSHMKATGPRLSTLLGTIRDASKTAAKRQLVLIDACREQIVRARGGAKAPAMGSAFAEAIEQARGQVVLAATVPGGFAYDDRERQNGVFTAAVLDGLRGAAPSNDKGLVTVDLLADFVHERVADWVRRHRVDHAEVSRGITSTIEHEAKQLPLAFDAEFFERAERWKQRVDGAVGHLKSAFDGDVITGTMFDQVVKLVRSGDEKTVLEWVEEIEDLDDSTKSRRSFAYFVQQHFDAATEVVPAASQAPSQAPAVQTARRTEPKVGDVWTDPVLGMRFRYIPPGSFLMGSPEDEPGREVDETQHEVTLTRGFWVAETVVTQGQWHQLMGNNPSVFSETDEHPVERVNWFEAVAYANALSKKSGLEPCYEISGSNGHDTGEGFEAEKVAFDADRNGFRLLTEAQWEFAARAGTTTSFWTGENITTDQANYDGNYPYAAHPKGEYRETTVPVRSFDPNPWGLYEVHGNVWEWCWDWFGEYEKGPCSDPLGPARGSHRIVRGSSWYHYARLARTACRGAYESGDRDDYLGFRLSRGSEPD